mmetsp:Transcript_4522/g.12777  ORF Transcript_4522/g.12777 Transcript_4522/m.12777 type:complete len:554 (+) Transcript_4522:154-1815(+)
MPASSVCAAVRATHRRAVDPSRPTDVRAMSMLALALLCATAPLELSQMGFALAGAAVYALMCCLKVSPPKAAPRKAKPFPEAPGCEEPPAPRALRCSSGARPRAPPPGADRRAAAGHRRPAVLAPTQDVRRPTLFPVARPALSATRWDEEVQELVEQVAPSEETLRVAARLALVARRELRSIIPEVEVIGLAHGNLGSGTANGVAVPEVEVVATISPAMLPCTLAQPRRGGRTCRPLQLQGTDHRRLQKAALRSCTDALVSSGAFRFRRSAFRGQDPKVTLLATPAACVSEQAVPMDFSFNSSTPLQNAAMLAECGRLEPRSRDLILLVRRWCKDRAICHSAKGHLSPYAWTLMTIFYLQARADDGGPVLPPLADFEFASALIAHKESGSEAAAAREAPAIRARPAEGARKTVGELFKGFVRFYAREFEVRSEAVSVTGGRRGPPSLAMPLHIVVDDCSDKVDVAPTVEDPFKPGTNLSSSCTYASLQRLREELTRADRICSEGGSLAELLELWAPPADASAASSAGTSATRASSGSDAQDDAADFEAMEVDE